MCKATGALEMEAKTDSLLVASQIPRSENHQADDISKLASSVERDVQRTVFWEVKPAKSIDQEQVMFLSRGNVWMDPIIEFKKTGRLSTDPLEAKYVKARDKWFELWDKNLYKKSFNRPLLKCITREDGLDVLKELHEGACASHIEGRALGEKALRTGYYWPTFKEDAFVYAKKCDSCQRHGNMYQKPSNYMTRILFPLPFAKWGIDILGPFPFETPKLKECLADQNIKAHFAAVAHPQANGQVETFNKILSNCIKKKLDNARGLWVEELQLVLWSIRTTSKKSAGEIPFILDYGSEAVLPIEIEEPTLRVMLHSEETNSALRTALDQVLEVRGNALLRMQLYKLRMAREFNKRVTGWPLKVGDLVLRKMEAVGCAKEMGKLTQNWEGPYKIV
ncbi:uncharacterized protein LOC104906374 [Beta vulgaris subsp. vulgaris]|uniref:uncharacterized protein LOC104906374 n=1 Tax=Beta vulgaris subsp. vulgaris TaxID=3555 RepID=UPI00053F6CFF|nr:uncharacterized protein LOC104906374 [Beta vulgaris subsp. vulgaris]